MLIKIPIAYSVNIHIIFRGISSDENYNNININSSTRLNSDILLIDF